MKQKLYLAGLITALIIFTGTIFKVNHFPGAGILLTIGLAILALFFIPAALVNNYRNNNDYRNRSLYVVTAITCSVVFIAMLFKVQHWPFAGLSLTIAIPFPYVEFLPVFLIVTSRNKNFNIYNTVFVLLLLALNSVFSALLALNVAFTRISDSYNMSSNYVKIDTFLTKPPQQNQSPTDKRIDELIKTINECRILILKHEGMTGEQWKNNPEILARAEGRNFALWALEKSGASPGEKLGSELKELISTLKSDPSYKDISDQAALIFQYSEQGENEPSWEVRMFGENTLSWSLIYLDGLEANLTILKASI